MMLLQIYSVRDLATGQFLPGSFHSHDVNAIREFQDFARNPQSQISKYPESFDLVRVGTFETDTGVVAPVQIPAPLISGIQAKKQEGKSDVAAL